MTPSSRSKESPEIPGRFNRGVVVRSSLTEKIDCLPHARPLLANQSPKLQGVEMVPYLI